MANLISLCASHINCKERLHSIKVMINSLLDQIDPVNIFISISCEDEFKNDVENIINSYESKHDILKFQFHSQKQSQFEHYKSLCDMFKHNNKDTWCLFCDDDDFCHPQRNSFYKTEINKIIANKNNISMSYPIYQSIYFTCSELQHYDDNMPTHESSNILEPTDSQHNLSKITSLLDKNEAKINDGGQDYFMFCCRCSVLDFFFEIVNNDIIKDLGCDLVFRNLLRCLPCKKIEKDIICNNYWLYAHTRNNALKPATLDVDYEEIKRIWKNIRYDLYFKWEYQNSSIMFDINMTQFRNMVII